MDNFFGLDKETLHDENLELLETAYDNVRIAIIRSILDGEKIPYVIKQRGSNAVGVIFGVPLFGADIYVHKCDIERAIKAIEPPENNSSENDEENSDKDENPDG